MSPLSLSARIYDILRQKGQSQNLPFAVGSLAFFFGLATYFALTNTTNLNERMRYVMPLIYIDLLLLLLLCIIVAKRLVELWQKRRRGLKGAKLHVHLVVLFSLVTLAPASIVGLFSPLFFSVGLESWFGQPVRDALDEAKEVASAYFKEHQRNITIDAQSIVNNLRPYMSMLVQNTAELEEVLNNIADERGMTELLIFSGDGKVVARSYLSFALEFDLIPEMDFDRLKAEEIVLRTSSNHVRALIKIDPNTDTYLFIGKSIDKKVLQHVRRTEGAVNDYAELVRQHSGAHLIFILFFAIVALLLMLAAIWVGLNIANKLIEPIQTLIAASEEVSQGNLAVRIEQTHSNNELDDLVLSFNKMTRRLQLQNQELIVSQRKSAWADVARRIAHEIKNPLTPIQLSAERLKRRFLKEITSDPDVFAACVDTITRQVEHIGKLVREFSAFARMPDPVFEIIDMGNLCQQSIFIYQQSHPHIHIELSKPAEEILWPCDPQQIGQIMTNLIQNALNSIEEQKDPHSQAHVRLRIEMTQEDLFIHVEDSGPGFPKDNRKRFLEPYMTTREKGSGLGLAIVSKIVSDHNGYIELSDSILGGACVTLVFAPKKGNS